jgi:hypothetical protein
MAENSKVEPHEQLGEVQHEIEEDSVAVWHALEALYGEQSEDNVEDAENTLKRLSANVERAQRLVAEIRSACEGDDFDEEA